MERSGRRYLLILALAVLLGGAGWSLVLASDEGQAQTTRSLGIAGVALFSLLAGRACAQMLKPWLASRHAPPRGLIDR